MKPLQVPQDEDAERQVAGACISNPARAKGLDQATANDFRILPLGRIFAAREELASIRFLDDRAARGAELSGVSVDEALALVSGTRVTWAFECYARRVADAARRRRAMSSLADAFNEIGRGAAVEDVQPTLEGLGR